jgi:hypothetical protein
MVPAMTEFAIGLLTLLPLEVLLQPPTPTSSPAVYPSGSQGFAAYIIGGFIGLSILLIAMALLNRRPKRVKPPIPDD